MQKSTRNSDQNRPNSLGLRERELETILSGLDQQFKETATSRAYSRWRYQQLSIPVRIVHPGGSELEVRMACRNLSKGGIGLFHRSFLHLGTRLVVTLEDPVKGPVRVAGSVVRCLHLFGMVHEIGVVFDEQIDIRRILRPDPMQELLAIETIDPSQLVGSILLVEDSAMDARLVKHFLRDTQLRIAHAVNIEEGERLALAGVGLVLCDIHLGEENGGELARRLFESPCQTPVVLTSVDTSETTRELVSKPWVAGFLAKPFTQENLIRTIAEFITEPGKGINAASGGGVKADRQLVSAMLPELRKASEQLETAAAEDDATLALSILMQIKGVAPILGLSELASLVDACTDRLASNMEIGEIRDQIPAVVAACRVVH